MGVLGVVVGKGCPMPVPVAPPDSRPVAPGVDVREGADGGVVFLWGMACWCWQPDDVAARRLAAVQLVGTGAAKPGVVAGAFGTDEVTLWRWRRDYDAGGVGALTPKRRGPKGPSKIDQAKIDEIRRWRGEGLSRDAVAERVGVSGASVSRVLAGVAVSSAPEPGPVGGLEPLAKPVARDEDRQAAPAR